MSYYQEQLPERFGEMRVGGGPEPYGALPQPPPPGPPPPLAPGWRALLSQDYRREYYVYEPTGRTQWEAPLSGPPMDPYAARDPGYGGGGYAQPPPGPGYDEYNRGPEAVQQVPQEEPKSDHKELMMGALGGLAVGAIGGALVAEALDDDDDEEKSHHSDEHSEHSEHSDHSDHEREYEDEHHEEEYED